MGETQQWRSLRTCLLAAALALCGPGLDVHDRPVAIQASAASQHPDDCQAAVSTAGAAPQVDELPFYLEPVGGLGGQMTAVASDGRHTFADQGDYLVAYDMSDPGAPREVGRIRLPDARALQLGDGLLYAMHRHSLSIVDAAVPARMQVVGRVEMSSKGDRLPYLTSLQVAYPYAFVLSASKLMVVDIASPDAPRIVSEIEVVRARALAVDTDTVYLLRGFRAKLEVLDISDPLAPRSLSTTEMEGYGYVIAARDGIVYVGTRHEEVDPRAGRWATLRVFDARDPDRVTPTGELEILPPARLILSDDYLYLAETPVSCKIEPRSISCCDDRAALRVIDVGDPANPVSWGHLELGVGPPIVGMALARDRVDLVTAFDPNSSCSIGDPTVPDAPGLRVIDVGSPAAPNELAHLTPPDAVYHVVRLGRYVMLGDTQGLHLVDALDISRPEVVATWETGLVYMLAGAESRLYAVTDWSRYPGGEFAIRFFDVSRTGHPVERAVWNPGWTSLQSVARGSLLFAAAGADGLRIVDATHLAAPRNLAAVLPDADETVDQVVLDGRFAYLSTSKGLTILDVRDSARPRILAKLPLPGNSIALTAKDGLVHLSRWRGDIEYLLLAVDARDPRHPELITREEGWHGLGPLARLGGYLLAGSTVYDVSEPSAIRPVGPIDGLGWPWERDGCTLYQAAGLQGFRIGMLRPTDSQSVGPTSTPPARDHLNHLLHLPHVLALEACRQPWR